MSVRSPDLSRAGLAGTAAADLAWEDAPDIGKALVGCSRL